MAATTAVIGVAAVRQIRQPREILLAVVPLLFALQQTIEGLLWLLLDGEGDAAAITALSFAYLLFAEVLWPAYVALAVLLIEPDRRRRRILWAIAAAGLLLSLHLLTALLNEAPAAVVRGHSIDYLSTVSPLSWLEIPYLVTTVVALLLSSHRIIQVFGAVVAVGFMVSAYVYTATFISVWCFFAAADSTLLYLYFRRAARALRVREG